MVIDLCIKAVEYGLNKGCKFVEIRYENTVYEHIQYLNGRLKEVGSERYVGIGVRVIFDSKLGFSSTDSLLPSDLRKTVDYAIKAAKASNMEVKIADVKPLTGTFKTPNVKLHPQDKEFSEKIMDVKDIFKHATDVDEASKLGYFTPKKFTIKNSTIRYTAIYGDQIVVNSEGTNVVFNHLLTGYAISIVAEYNGILGDGRLSIGGSMDYSKLINEMYKHVYDATWKSAEKAVAKPPPPGKHLVISYPEITGLFAHESFGHMSEGDFILTGSSPLKDKIGSQIASDIVSIVDDGTPEYFPNIYLPVDSEGVKTKKVYLVKDGIDTGFLHSRLTASELNDEPTGNARAENHRHIPLVRMRNTFFERGDWSEEEIKSEFKRGIVVDDGLGGQAELDGTFTFSASRGYYLEGGEYKYPIRDVILQGNILEMLKNVVAAGNYVYIDSAPFGACGKGGQRVYVGLGGPILVIKDMLVGGRHD